MIKPLVMYQVVEKKIVYDRRTQRRKVDVHVGNLYADEDVAEREVEGMREAWEDALAEWEEEGHRCIYYEQYEAFVREKHLSLHQIKKAEGMDQDRWETMAAAMDAVTASQLDFVEPGEAGGS
jgi:hypothetical protein